MTPGRLRTGDLVAIVAPSGCPPYEDQIQRGVKFLESFGLRVRLGPSVTQGRGYINRDRRLRVDDLHGQFTERRVRGIFCLVGGFSAFEILDLLDYDLIGRHPKIFMGFSDNTSLLNAVHRKTGLITYMGENILWGLSEMRAPSKETFARTFLEEEPHGEIGCDVWRDGKRRSGRIVAANLSTLVWVMGTKFEPRWPGSVLFWEDVGENVDDLNSALWRLRISGVFSKLRGMVVGHLEGIGEEEKFGVTVRASLLRAVEPPIPILKTEAFGHRVPSVILPIGGRCRIGAGRLFLES